MAVGFQRRNVGRLIDVANMGDGTEAYVDYGQAPIAQATSAEPVEGEVLPPESPPSNAQNDMDRAEQAASDLISAAARQRDLAGNPLHRVLSGVGGVIGAPFAFIDAALGGGDMTRVTAPFRPKQMAEDRFNQTVLAIQDSLSKVRENYAQTAASNAQALRAGLTSSREEEQAGRDSLGMLTSSMLYMDPAARRQRLPALAALARRYPSLEPEIQELINTGFDNASLAALGSMSSDEGARKRANDFLYGRDVTPSQEAIVITSNRPGDAPVVIDRSTNGVVPGMTAVTGYTDLPTPQPTGAIDFSSMSDEQLDAYIQAQGGN